MRDTEAERRNIVSFLHTNWKMRAANGKEEDAMRNRENMIGEKEEKRRTLIEIMMGVEIRCGRPFAKALQDDQVSHLFTCNFVSFLMTENIIKSCCGVSG